MLRHLLLLAPTLLFAQSPALDYIKTFGGTGIDNATAIATDRLGNIYTAGTTTSLDFPTNSAFQPRIGGANVRLSANQGTTWQAPQIPFPVYAVSNSPKRPNVVFAGTEKGIYKSVDNGLIWQALPTSPSLIIEALLVNAANPDTVCAATDNGIYLSADAGGTWRNIDLGISAVIALASSPARPATLYSATDVNLRRAGFGPFISANTSKARQFDEPIAANPSNLYRSSDDGASWSRIPNAPSGIFSLSVDPINPNLVYAANAVNGFSGGGPTSLYKSTDGGTTWTKTLDLPILTSTFTLAATHSAIYLGTPTGVIISRDGGLTFTPTSITAASGNIAFDPNNPNIVYAEADRVYRSSDAGVTWLPTLQVKQEVDTMAVLATSPTPTVFVGSKPDQNVFITKWTADGSQMLYSTYLGGSSHDTPTGIAVDSQGNAFVTGYTFSLDFPVTTGAQQSINRGTANAFLAKIGPNGDKLLYSTFLGGNGSDAARALALDPTGNVYLTGYTNSPNFPVTPNAAQPFLNNSCKTPGINVVICGNAFITKIDGNTGSLIYSTFLGGSRGDQGLGIAVDNSGAATVVGVTKSPDFPVTTPLTAAPFVTGTAGFLAQLSPQGKIIRAAFVANATGPSTAEAVALDSAGDIYITGSTQDLGVSGAEINGSLSFFSVGFAVYPSGPAYLLKLSGATGESGYFHSLGGALASGQSVAIDASNRAWVAGIDYRFGFLSPIILVHPFQAYAGSSFVAQVSADGATTLFASATDDALALALSKDAALLAGSSYEQRGSQLIRIALEKLQPVTVEAPEKLFKNEESVYSLEGITPGEFLVLSGTNLGPNTPLSAQPSASGIYPRMLGGTTVTFDGLPAELLSVAADRVVCLIPFAIQPFQSRVAMQLTSSIGTANLIRVGQVTSAFSLTAAVNADGTQNSATAPATPGSIVTLYGTGFGQTTPPTADGVAAAALRRSPFFGDPPYAQIGNQQAEITYIGTAPGQLTAVTQINVRVPIGAQNGSSVVKIGLDASAGTIALYIR